MNGRIIKRQSSFVNKVTASGYWQAGSQISLLKLPAGLVKTPTANLAFPPSHIQYGSHQYKPFANAYQENAAHQSM
eukprot:5750041-Ditylum_brightwellii.AAC.1